ncbi:uncharacterized protein LOC113313683 [Papaver somniferum]|uniref:uncharacterized protein LOC113313683 n=1 Tax=Papaver somniferum TaxID=3469 RepID=UPI000E6FF031|nr:uncharacterized protein LOC113313683 [Papaver somniferum]
MIKGWILEENTLPSKYTEMKLIMIGLGMKCKAIHACPNHCILYYKEHENATSCPQCKSPRFKVKQGKFGPKQTKEPFLVLRHFRVGERLKRSSTGKEVTVDEVETQTKFIPWLVEKLVKEKKTDSVLWRLAQGPVGATEFIKYRVNGFMFSPRFMKKTMILKIVMSA